MSKRAVLLAAGFAAFALAAALAAAGKPAHSPTMKPPPTELEMTKDIDLGVILDTTSPLHLSIPLTNRSSRVITIQNLAKDCACTSVKVDKLTLAPGETATLRIVSNLTGKTNWYEGNIIVESDAVERIDQIRIHGRITGQIRIRPTRATLLTGEKHVPGSFSVFCDDQDGAWRYAGFTADDPALDLRLAKRETTPTTSVYDGTIDLRPGAAAARAAFQTAQITLRFVNDKLGRHFDLKYGVDIAVRRAVTVDPPQVSFLGKGTAQKRTVFVQSAQALAIDAARCASPCLSAAIHRINPKALRVDLVFRPALAQAGMPGSLACDLLSGGKTVGSFPINIVEIP